MKKTLINITGNMASGKSSLIEAIKPNFPTAKFFSIDQYRQNFHANTPAKNTEVWQRLIHHVADTHFAIVESSGVSRHFPQLCSAFTRNGGQVITIQLNINLQTAIIRATQRDDQNQILFKSANLTRTIQAIHRKLLTTQPHYFVDANQSEAHVLNQFRAIFRK